MTVFQNTRLAKNDLKRSAYRGISVGQGKNVPGHTIPIRRGALPLVCGIVSLLGGCGHENAGASGMSMANPASVSCIRQGGRSELRQEQAGITGYCHLPDGRVIEEWALFRQQNRTRQMRR